MNRTKLKNKTSVRPDQALMTAASSTQAVKTLISSGFGCIAWIRSGEMMSTLSSAGASSQVSASSTKVKVIKRNFSTEADSLLDYIDGIYEVLEKQYLKSFVFAIYLVRSSRASHLRTLKRFQDEENPNNLVESYTFTVSYEKVADTDVTAPVISLATDMSRMGLLDGEDPVSAATTNGRVPTLGEVKRSVRMLIKRLIASCQQMDSLPGKYLFAQIYYNDTAPPEYEPPHFVAGDAEKDRFYFSTHGVSQPPEKYSIGGVITGQHDVKIEIASISSYLPSPEDNNAPFIGHAVGSNVRSGFAAKEAKRKADAQAQLEDAARRRVVWDAEPFGRTDREDDPEGERRRQEALRAPLGIRRGDNIEPIPGIVRHTGGQHVVPGLNDALQGTEEGEDATQILETQATVIVPSAQETPCATQTNMEVDATQPDNTPGHEDVEMQGGAQPTVLDPTQAGTQQAEGGIHPTPKAIDPAVLYSKKVSCDCNIEDSTQETFICQGECGRRLHAWSVYGVRELLRKLAPSDSFRSFNNAREAGNSPYALCLGCGAKEQDWYALLEERDLVKLSEVLLALGQYRRTLKLIYIHGFPGNPHALGRLVGYGRPDALRIMNRLEGEGFIESRTIQSDELGMLATETATKNIKGKKSKKNKSSKPKLVLVNTPATEANFNRYFDPRGEIEQELFYRFKEQHLKPKRLKKANATPSQHGHVGNVLVPSSSQGPSENPSLDPLPGAMAYGENDTQTQEETQMVVDPERVPSVPPPSPPPRSAPKRRVSTRSSRGRGKRLKVSLANTRIELDACDAYE
ncbi:hypothetical protein RSOLAG22IIIB_00448 [Rhizoctonia solani]|uniref:HORMA domain-containing protein n=1 Tax=Rhizoctonia solani TaxID=456999 RepID=A0A0K6FVS5_9AGAM|nr:hypothetical protein RSOLAG22IIIB_00448 [Rhizoctonia solani]